MLTATDVTYATESLSDDLWSEMAPLIEDNSHEIPHFTDDIAVEPDRAGYGRIEANGALRVYTVRTEPPAADRGRLVGYMVIFVADSLHHRGLRLASLDAMFVNRRFRGGSVGRDLIRYAQECLRDEGAGALYMHVKQRQDIAVGPLLKRLGYTPVDEVWAIRLDREAHHG